MGAMSFIPAREYPHSKDHWDANEGASEPQWSFCNTRLTGSLRRAFNEAYEGSARQGLIRSPAEAAHKSGNAH
jgi:hypothetical protein